MAYNITVDLKYISYKNLTKILVWCHRHLCLDKDWAHSDESFILNGEIVIVPKTLWLNEGLI